MTSMKKLIDTQMLLASSFNSIKDLIMFSIDKNYHYLFFNENYRLFMKTHCDIDITLGMDINNTMCSSLDWDQTKMYIDLALSGFSRTSIQPFCRDRSFEMDYKTIYDQYDKMIGITVFAKDITAEVMKENKTYKMLFAHMKEGMAFHQVIYDEKNQPIDYRILSVNQSFLDMFHMDESMIVNKTIKEICPKIKRAHINKYADVAIHQKTIQFDMFHETLKKRFSLTAYSPTKGQFVTLISEIENAHANDIDDLTKLYNRRYFENAFHTFTNQNHLPLGVMMIDINGLKLINDTYGYKQGDLVIKNVSSLLKEVFNANDVIARVGGDEFAVLSPNQLEETMYPLREAIVSRANDMRVGELNISLSIGYVTVTECSSKIDDILKLTENYLYRHKITSNMSVRNHSIKAILNTLTDKYHIEKIHSSKVGEYCVELGLKLGLDKDDLAVLEMAGLYHDIGKISIPDAILKKPGKLTYDEFEIIKTHTQIGYDILKAADEYSGLAEYALHHHERWDGKGYPSGLEGEEIPLFARVINIADSFEAMTADRPYRKGMCIEDALAEIENCAGTQFDPSLARIFIDMMREKNGV